MKAANKLENPDQNCYSHGVVAFTRLAHTFINSGSITSVVRICFSTTPSHPQPTFDLVMTLIICYKPRSIRHCEHTSTSPLRASRVLDLSRRECQPSHHMQAVTSAVIGLIGHA